MFIVFPMLRCTVIVEDGICFKLDVNSTPKGGKLRQILDLALESRYKIEDKFV